MTPQNHLAALAARLSAKGVKVDLRADGLHVINPEVAGVCGDVARAGDTITCRPRKEDGGRLWFFTSLGESLAEADHITDATTAVMGHLAACHTGAAR